MVGITAFLGTMAAKTIFADSPDTLQSPKEGITIHEGRMVAAENPAGWAVTAPVFADSVQIQRFKSPLALFGQSLFTLYLLQNGTIGVYSLLHKNADSIRTRSSAG